MTMYRTMLYYLWTLIGAATILSFFNIIPFEWGNIVIVTGLSLLTCFIANLIFSKIFQVKPNYESQFITALILSLIVGPLGQTSDLKFLVLAAVAAMASKFLIKYKNRHIFNPAAFGVTLLAFLGTGGASWWIGNPILVWFVVAGGILVLRKLRWFHLTLSFLITYLLLTAAASGLANIMTILEANLLRSALLFFSMVMLIEPLTAPNGRRNRMFYGIGIAGVLFLLQKFTTLPYTLELSLLIGNVTFWLFRSNKERMTAKFTEKIPRAKNIYSFWFEPIKKINFKPGQFLEWTLPHEKPDSRGIRRWFTITASPTEERIMLTTKLAEKSSSFKTALNSLKPGDEIAISDPDGEFVLPDDGQKLVFIAGGIGITPYRSIVKYLLDTNQSRDIVLMYSAKTADEFAFGDLWSEAQKKFGLKTVYVATDEKGYINPEMIKQEVPDWRERLIYVSGPEPMVEAFEKMLAGMGVAPSNLQRDYFPGYTETYS